MGLQLVGYVVWMARMMINYHLEYRGTTRVRYDLFGKLQQLGMTYHKSRPQGDAIYRLSTDAFGPWGIMDVIIGTAVAAVTLTVMTAIMLSRNVSLTLAAFTVAPLMIWSNWRFGLRIHQRALESKEIDADLTSVIQQAMARVSASRRRSAARPTSSARFSAAVLRSVAALLRLNWQEQLYPLARDGILAVGGAIILGYGGYLVYRDQFVAPVAGGMTVGTLIIFMDYIRKLWDPLKWLTEFVAKVRVFEAAAPARVPRARHAGVGRRRRPAPIDAAAAAARPDPRHVGFGYRDGQAVLRDVSAEIRPGRDGRLRRPERHRQEHPAQPHAALLRPDPRRAAPRRRRFPRRSASPISGGTWRSSARTASCCRRASPRTSPTAAPARARARSPKPPRWPAPPTSSRTCPRATTRS